MSTAAIAEEAGLGRLEDLEIATVEAHALNVPATIEVAGERRDVNLSVCICEIETKGGIRGHGFTAITEEEVVDAAVQATVSLPAHTLQRLVCPGRRRVNDEGLFTDATDCCFCNVPRGHRRGYLDINNVNT